VGLYRRRKIKREMASGELPKWKGELMMRTEPQPVSLAKYERLGAPTVQSLLRKARTVLDDMEPERYGPLRRAGLSGP
jgi:hypothetical protein